VWTLTLTRVEVQERIRIEVRTLMKLRLKHDSINEINCARMAYGSTENVFIKLEKQVIN